MREDRERFITVEREFVLDLLPFVLVDLDAKLLSSTVVLAIRSLLELI